MATIDTRRRKRVSFSGESVVSIGSLPGGNGFPAVLQPTVPEFDLADWCANNREHVHGLLSTHAALLFRGCRIGDAARFRQVIEAACGELLSYQERAAPRRELERHVYTSTEFPADQTIPLHHEMSYAHRWPLRICFCCAQPAAAGGCTPICDDRQFIAQLPASIRARFERSGVMYVRNYGQGPDFSWQDAFQTSNRSDVEAYCAGAGMTCEWGSGDRLRTRYVGPAVVEHPRSGQIVWFNHAHMFHVSNLPVDVRTALLQQFAEDELPRNACYGDGAPIESSVLEEIRSRYDRLAVRFAWLPGDVLLLDNVLASHGRDPYTGDRQIVVAMADLCTHRAPAVRLSSPA